MTSSQRYSPAVQHFKRVSPNAQDGAILLQGILNNLSRSTAAARRRTVPNGDEYVAMVHDILARVGIRIAAKFCHGFRIAALVLDAPRAQKNWLIASPEQFLKLLSRLLTGKVFEVVFERQWKDNTEMRIGIVEHGPCHHAIRPFRQRTQNTE